MKIFFFKFNAVILICIIGFITFSGCTSSRLKTIELSSEYQKAIKNIRISNDINFACNDYEVIPYNYTMFGCCIAGPCGCLPGAMIDVSRGIKYKKELDKDANLEEILKTTLNKQFISVLKDVRHFQYVEDDNKDIKPDAEFVFVIQNYGLYSDASSTKKLTPVM